MFIGSSIILQFIYEGVPYLNKEEVKQTYTNLKVFFLNLTVQLFVLQTLALQPIICVLAYI